MLEGRLLLVLSLLIILGRWFIVNITPSNSELGVATSSALYPFVPVLLYLLKSILRRFGLTADVTLVRSLASIVAVSVADAD